MIPTHSTLHNQNFLPTSQTIIPVHQQQTAQSLPIAYTTSQVIAMSNLVATPFNLTNSAAIKPILHNKNSHHHKTKKRSVAKIDDKCLMTNHLIEDQL